MAKRSTKKSKKKTKKQKQKDEAIKLGEKFLDRLEKHPNATRDIILGITFVGLTVYYYEGGKVILNLFDSVGDWLVAANNRLKRWMRSTPVFAQIGEITGFTDMDTEELLTPYEAYEEVKKRFKQSLEDIELTITQQLELPKSPERDEILRVMYQQKAVIQELMLRNEYEYQKHLLLNWLMAAGMAGATIYFLQENTWTEVVGALDIL